LAAGIQFFLPLAPGTPENLRKAWEDAFSATIKDPEYIAQVEKQGGKVHGFNSGAATITALEGMYKGFKTEEALSVIREQLPHLLKK